MRKFKLILDESGKFERDFDKYIILGGLLFDVEYEVELENILVPVHANLCNAFNIKELHGSEEKKLFDYLCCSLGSIEKLNVILFVIDKEKTFIFDTYDEKSFKYNKAIEHVIKKLLSSEIINSEDKIHIKIDNINLSEKGKDNLAKYLPKIFSCVEQVEEVDSKNVICMQFADVIVNKFTLKKHHRLDSKEIRLLNPKIYFFLNETEQDYLIKK